MLLSDMLPAIAGQLPASNAIKQQDLSLTYEELLDRVTRLAGALQKLGLQPGERVALLDHPSINLIAMELAAVALGAIPFAIFPELSAQEIRQILEDASPSVIMYEPRQTPLEVGLTDIDGIKISTESGGEGLYIGDFLREDSPVLAASDWHRADPNDPAILIYTGGTTGRAKGVIHTHRSIGSWFNINPPGGLGHAPGQKSIGFNLAHLTGQSVLWMTLAAGGCVHLFGSYPFDTEQVITLVQREHITHMGTVGRLLREIIQQLEYERKSLPSLRVITCGGAPIHPSTLQKAVEYFPSAMILEVYSQTESGMMISMLSANVCLQDGTVERLQSVGKPENMKRFGQKPFAVRLVDDAGNDLPFGQVGEIILQGEQVMRGYWNNDSDTMYALRDGWLHTGDMGRLDHDGCLYLVDRKKDMVIVDASNVYCPEVELVIEQHPAVLEVAVIGVQNEVEDEQVAAVVVLAPGATLGLEELRSFCSARLAPFKLPSKLWIVEALPRTIVNKIDKKMLRNRFNTLMMIRAAVQDQMKIPLLD